MTVPPELPGPNSGARASNTECTREVKPAHLELRLDLMAAVRRIVRQRRLRQRDAAVLFGVGQPRVSDLVRGKVALFSIDTLVDMLAALGVTVTFELRTHRTTANAIQAADSLHSSRSRRQRSDAESGIGE
jgi:predicted XRE-type DNA-binding protein